MVKINFEAQAKDLVSKMTLKEKIAQMRYDAPAIDRLNIPSYNWWNESLHGVARSGAATVFPQPIAMAASFDDELLFKIGDAISDEARAKFNEYKTLGQTRIYQGLTFWSPNINIFRDPRWGRGHETYGEDPFLTAKMGTSFVKGLQGNGKYRKVDATLKHYAVHSGPESVRHSFNAEVNDEDLWETYLYAFDYCIKHADPSAVMGAYNAINGEPCCASPKYLKDILFNKLNFKGYVVSDCGAICDITEYHKMNDNLAISAANAVNNGCHLNCGTAYTYLVAATAASLISEETITEAVEKLFTARFRLGLFSKDCEYDKLSYDVVECKKHQDLNLKMALESMVLLKNDCILPLKNKKLNIGVIGPQCDNKDILLGNYNGTPSTYTTLLKGLQDYSLSTDCKIRYAYGSHLYKESNPTWQEQYIDEAILCAKNSDIVILMLGLTPQLEGEEGDAYNSDNAGDKSDLEWPKVQRELYSKVVENNKNVILVNVSGSAINLSKPKEECKAIIQCFYPGSRGGEALAKIIFGECSPTGKLPVTFYRSCEDLPAFEDYSMKNRTYKFFTGEIVYPFGYGLTYNNIEENWIDKDNVEIINKGDYEINYPVLKFETKPYKKLVAFKKIKLIPNSKQIIKITNQI